MHSLSSLGSGRLSAVSQSVTSSRLGWMGTLAALLSVGGVAGCSDGDDSAATVSLADSGTLAALTPPNGLQIPTTVTVTQGLAWVAESQFNHYTPFGGDGMPGDFRLVGYPLAAGSQVEYIPLPPDFYPEGVTSSPRDGRLYVGSVANGSIYTVGPNVFAAVPFVRPDVLGGSVFGMTVSQDQTTLFACFGDEDGARLLGLDIATATVVVSHELPPVSAEIPSFCNDVIMSPNGNLWVTESFGGRLFRIPAENVMTSESAEVWLEAPNLAGPDGPAANSFGANGLTLVSGRLYIANTDRGTLWKIDPSLAEPTEDDLVYVEFAKPDAEPAALAKPDGIFAIGVNQLLIVENGLGLSNGQQVWVATIDRL